MSEERRQKFPFNMNYQVFKNEKTWLHEHDFSEMVVILGGSGVHELNHRRYNVEAGDVFVLNGRDHHLYEKALGLRLFNLHYDPNHFFGRYRDLRRLPGFQALFAVEPHLRRGKKLAGRLQLSRAALIRVHRLLTEMMEEFRKAEPGRELLIESLFRELVIFLVRQYGQSNDERLRPVLGLAKAASYAEEHFVEPIELGDLAKVAGMSPNHFIRVFRDTYRMTPIQYVIRLRLARAARLLVNPEYNVTAAALASGFDDSNYFSRLFRQKYGISPRQYRRSHRT